MDSSLPDCPKASPKAGSGALAQPANNGMTQHHVVLVSQLLVLLSMSAREGGGVATAVSFLGCYRPLYRNVE